MSLAERLHAVGVLPSGGGLDGAAHDGVPLTPQGANSTGQAVKSEGFVMCHVVCLSSTAWCVVT